MTTEALVNAPAGGISGWRRALGAAILTVCIVGSALLAADQLHRWSLPGCSPPANSQAGIAVSDCQALLQGFSGKLGATGWPISFVGIAYFLGLLAGWLRAPRAGLPWSLRWMTRLGLLGSAWFVGVMYIEQRWCLYCAAVHVGNLAFWLVAETTVAGPLPRRPVVAFVVVAFSVTLVLGLSQHRLQKQAEQQANLALEASLRQVVSVSRGGPSEPAADRPAFEGHYPRGPAQSSIRLVVFTDYQCGHCRALDALIHQALRGRSGVRFSVKQFPLCQECNSIVASGEFHANACRAAYAAEAAGLLRGDEGFWAMHHWLFERQGAFSEQDLSAALPKLGFPDTAKFLAAMNGPEVRAKVAADVQDAQRFGVAGTPTSFVNGVQVNGLGSLRALEEMFTKLEAEDLPARTAAFDRPTLVVEQLYAAWRQQKVIDIPAGKSRWTLGDEKAPIRVALFLDCHQRTSAELAAHAREWAAKQHDVRVEFFLFPYTEEALAPSRLVEAAGRVGGPDAFWRMHDWFCQQGEASGAAQEGLKAAASLKLDHDKLAAEFAKDAVKQAVDDDIRFGVACGVSGAPRMYVNGRLVNQAKPSKDFLERILSGARNPEEPPAPAPTSTPVTPAARDGADADSSVRSTGSVQ